MKHSEVRGAIVETASRLFYQNGYNLTGINEIIREAGIAKATLYSHFRSKDDICIAYLDFRNEAFLTQIEAYARHKTPGKAQVLAIFDFLKSFYNEEQFNGCWCINTFSEIPRENEKIISHIQKQKQEFLQLIDRLVKQNFPSQTSSTNKALARQIYLLYEGAISESHIHRDIWPIAAARTMASNLLS